MKLCVQNWRDHRLLAAEMNQNCLGSPYAVLCLSVQQVSLTDVEAYCCKRKQESERKVNKKDKHTKSRGLFNKLSVVVSIHWYEAFETHLYL